MGRPYIHHGLPCGGFIGGFTCAWGSQSDRAQVFDVLCRASQRPFHQETCFKRSSRRDHGDDCMGRATPRTQESLSGMPHGALAFGKRVVMITCVSRFRGTISCCHCCATRTACTMVFIYGGEQKYTHMLPGPTRGVLSRIRLYLSYQRVPSTTAARLPLGVRVNVRYGRISKLFAIALGHHDVMSEAAAAL